MISPTQNGRDAGTGTGSAAATVATTAVTSSKSPLLMSSPTQNGRDAGTGTGTVATTAVTSSKSLLQQLPAGAVLAFQALSATFTNQGNCYASNWWLTVGLVTILSSTCIFFSFTDSLVHNGKVYYGVAVPGRLNILNMHEREEKVVFRDLRPQLRTLGLTAIDWVHAFLSLVVFLTIAGSDVGLQNCFFPHATDDTRQLLRNLPLGMAVMSSFLFMIFPTTRKGIRLDNNKAPDPAPLQEKKEDEAEAPAAAAAASSTAPASQEKKEDKAAAPAAPAPALLDNNKAPDPAPLQEKKEDEAEAPAAAAAASSTAPASQQKKEDKAAAPPAPALAPAPAQEKKEDEAGAGKKATDRAVMSSVNLLQLLPTGPVLAFQTLAASFTNQGSCYRSNWWLTVGLVVFLSVTCIFSSFTDSVPDKEGKVHKGLALPGRLHIISMSKKDQAAKFHKSSLRERRLKTVDSIHGFFSAVVFLTIAGSDVGLQNCFFPKANDDTRQLLKNLPLGMAVMSSFVFVIFPTTRNGIRFDDNDSVEPTRDLEKNDTTAKAQQ